jgi:hypothetical protein
VVHVCACVCACVCASNGVANVCRSLWANVSAHVLACDCMYACVFLYAASCTKCLAA